MESIYRLVNDSMARHGFEPNPAEGAEGGNHLLCHPEAALAAEGSMHHLWGDLELKSFIISDRENQQPRPDHLRLNWSRWIRCESSFSVLLVPAKPGIFALGEEMVPPVSMTVVDGKSRVAGIKQMQASTVERRASSPVEFERSENAAGSITAEASPPTDPAPKGRPSLAQRFSAGEAEKTIQVPEGRPKTPGASKRMLALFQISEADDLGMVLGRLFLPGNPLLAKLNSGRCFTRYAVIEDAAQRSAAYAIFERWMRDSSETASGISSCGADALVREDAAQQPCGSDTRVREGVHNKEVDSEVVQAVPPSISSAWGVGFMEVQNREAREVVCRPQPLPSGF